MYRHVYGDKETFWIGFELAKQAYAFNPSGPSPMGIATRNQPPMYELCSVQILHVDLDGRPFWFNGGLFKNKNIGNDDLIVVKEFMTGPGNWSSNHLDGYYACMSLSTNKTPLVSFNEEEMLWLEQIILKFISLTIFG